MIRTLIVDDQNLVREGIKLLLERSADIEIVGEAQNGYSALERIDRLQPDIVLLDINMPDIDGLTLAKEVRSKFPQIDIIMLSSCEGESYIKRATELGAKGYLLKSVSSQELEWSIKLVHQGYSTIKSGLLAKQNPHSIQASTLAQVSSPQNIANISEKNLDLPRENHSPTANTAEKTQDSADIELSMAKYHFERKYRQKLYARRQKHRKISFFHGARMSQLKKTLTSFEFQLLVFIILLSLGFLVSVALS
ncbi:response regulator transcription factor [Pleurocapsales cyanobacterium LEGE 10410]|nr:response regulator transcription factor [Pleurocapsales cyanobacterium LEGE 10410]